VRDRVDRLEPYGGGNEDLWLLHDLNIRDKHRLLLSAASAIIKHDLLPSQKKQMVEDHERLYPGAPAPTLEGVRVKPKVFNFPMQVGQMFLSIPRGDMENGFKFKLGVALNEVGVAPGESIGETLHRFVEMVAQITDGFLPYL
jgi:hypothetical protein